MQSRLRERVPPKSLFRLRSKGAKKIRLTPPARVGSRGSRESSSRAPVKKSQRLFATIALHARSTWIGTRRAEGSPNGDSGAAHVSELHKLEAATDSRLISARGPAQ